MVSVVLIGDRAEAEQRKRWVCDRASPRIAERMGGETA